MVAALFSDEGSDIMCYATGSKMVKLHGRCEYYQGGASHSRKRGQPMSTTLEQVIEQVKQLEPAQRQAIAAQFQRVLDDFLADQRWEQLLSDPRGLEVLHRMAQEAVEAYNRGETEEGGGGG